MLKSSKIEYERIVPDKGSSFRLIEVDGNFNSYFWHAHPEFEIVYIQKGQGRQKIGTHISEFNDGEINFIGPNIPHLGFGFGAHDANSHKEVVVQLKEDFLGEKLLSAPEFDQIKTLFQRGKRGLSFKGQTQIDLGKRLQKLTKLEGIDRLLELIKILQIMAVTTDFTYLNANEFNHEPILKDNGRFEKIMKYVEENYQNDIRLDELATIVNLAAPSFCRYFRQLTQTTFSEFLNDYRISKSKEILINGNAVADACFETGFNSLSHFDKVFKKSTGLSPTDFKKKWGNE